MADYPTIQGVAPSWSDVAGPKFVIYQANGSIGQTIQLAEVSAFKWSQSVEVGDYYGANGGRKLKTTTGKLSCEGAVTMTLEAWQTLRDALAAVSERYSLTRFDVLFQYTPPGVSAIHTIKAVGGRVIGVSGDAADGVDAQEVEVTLNLMRVEENGKALL